MKKVIAGAILLSLVIILITPKATDAKLRTYYSGDAVLYNKRIVVASTNMGRVEFLALEGSNLALKSTINLTGQHNAGKDGFYDVAMRVEGGKLFAYLVDGQWMYKYDISTPTKPVLSTKIHDNSWDWFLGVRLLDNGLVTIGTKGLKFYNDKLQVVDSEKIINDNQYNISLNSKGDIMADITPEGIVVSNPRVGEPILDAKLFIKENHGRKVLFLNDKIYFVDDQKLQIFDGKTLKFVKHGGKFGYDVVSSMDGKYLFVSVGNYIEKIDIKSLKIVARVDTTNLGATGGWAMGLERVGKSIVIFNGTSVLVLSENLKYSGSARASVEAIRPWMPIATSLSTTSGYPEDLVIIKGNGFGYNELVKIDFAGTKYTATTNDEGSFKINTYVPKYKKGVQVINFEGVTSAVKYQTSFSIR